MGAEAIYGIRSAAALMLLIALSACSPTAEKVCRYQQTLDADHDTTACLTRMRHVESNYPSDWPQLASCWLAASEPHHWGSCEAAAALVEASAQCRAEVDTTADAEASRTAFNACLAREQSARAR